MQSDLINIDNCRKVEQDRRLDQKEDRGVIHWQQDQDWQRKGRIWEGLW